MVDGDHCGKYVHWVHHQYEDSQSIIIVAVINHMDDGHESLLKECLELSPDELCLSFETKEEKQWNNGLMSGLHEEARKTHAK